MFYDLNIPYTPNDPHLPRTLAFLHELGYHVAALNHSMTGKLPADLTSPIPSPLPTPSLPPALTILRRVTLTLTETHQNARLAALARNYDILALRPIDERTLQLACGSLDCDIISLDLTQRLPYHFKHKTLSEAIKAGKRFEICYSQGVLGDAQARRNLISNATQLIRASRGRGLIICSESKAGAVGLRGPWDAVNLAAVWELGQERGYEAVSKEARSVVVSARLRRSSYRGVVDIVYGGEKPAPSSAPVPLKGAPKDGKGKQKQQQQQKQQGLKRKADALTGSDGNIAEGGQEQGISKREAKRRAKAQANANGSAPLSTDAAVEKSVSEIPGRSGG